MAQRACMALTMWKWRAAMRNNHNQKYGQSAIQVAAVITLLAALVNVACKPQARGQKVSFAEACNGTYYSKRINGEYIGPRIAFPGYISLSGMGLQSDTLLVELYETPGKKGNPIRVRLYTHGGKNSINKLPAKYTPSDLKINVETGEVLTSHDKVIVHGEHIGGPGEPMCLFKVFVIEKG